MTHPPELLLRLYETMVLIRTVEESFVEPILSGEVRCPCHLYSGEEAIAAGICAALTERDAVFGTHRSHGHFLAKGGSLDAMVAEVYCRESGCCGGRGGSMHLVDPAVGMLGAAPIVAGTIPLALGAALASDIREDGTVAVAFFGDGAAGEGVLYESLNFAALKRLPLIFVCENNLYSTHLPLRECRVERPIAEVAHPFGITAKTLDGNDVLAVHEAALEVVRECREGRGPVFLECLTYRFRGHVGPDDNIQGSHTDIRPAEEVARWLQRDPILLLEGKLKSSGLLDDAKIGEVRQAAAVRVAQAHARATRAAFPEAKELLHHV
ncbi:MAG: thiamine pyrophosphate-dependent dehydrogenase E1 component subunit alpha [Acidobacteria bacterium]|nr:thiamine pyrophosphate-dependent dehydrogenase E1 component subunit alpha [Acidobacteriota bacterium]